VEVICRKLKTQVSRNISLHCQYKYDTECKYCMKWFTVIETQQTHRFSMLVFLFIVLKNQESTLSKMYELHLPSVHLLGLLDVLFLQTSLRKIKIHSNMSC